MTTPTYEFTSEQEASIGRLARRMDVVGKVLLVLAGLAVLGALFGQETVERIDHLVSGVLFGLIGWWTVRAARSFQDVATTEGHDIPHLMTAIGELYKLYSLQFWVIVVMIVVLVLGVVAGVAGAMR